MGDDSQPPLSATLPVPAGPPVWSIHFSKLLANAMSHPIILSQDPEEISRMVEIALQFSVLCRTNNQTGTWAMPDVSIFGCPIMDSLSDEVSTSLAGGETIHQRHVRIQQAHDTEPSLMSRLLHQVGVMKVKMGTDTTHPTWLSIPTDTLFVLKTADVKAVHDAIEAVDPAHISCAEGYKRLRLSIKSPTWPQQHPTMGELQQVIEDATLSEERYWRHRALASDPSMPVGQAVLHTPTTDDGLGNAEIAEGAMDDGDVIEAGGEGILPMRVGPSPEVGQSAPEGSGGQDEDMYTLSSPLSDAESLPGPNDETWRAVYNQIMGELVMSWRSFSEDDSESE